MKLKYILTNKILSLPKFEILFSVPSNSVYFCNYKKKPSRSLFISDDYLIFSPFDKNHTLTLYNIPGNSKTNLKFTKLNSIEDFEIYRNKLYLISEVFIFIILNNFGIFNDIKSLCIDEELPDSPIALKKKRKLEDLEHEEIPKPISKPENKILIENVKNNVLHNFQPTAINFEKANEFYIVWNTIGTIAKVRSGLDKRSLIKISFHDVTLHSQIVLNNDSDFYIGDIAENNVCLVSKFSPDKPTKYF